MKQREIKMSSLQNIHNRRDLLTRPVFIRNILKYALPRHPTPFWDDASSRVLAQNILTKISVFYQVCSSWRDTIIYFSSGVLSPLLLPKSRIHFLRVFFEVCAAFNNFFVQFLVTYVNSKMKTMFAGINEKSVAVATDAVFHDQALQKLDVNFADFESAITSSPRYFAFRHLLIEQLFFKDWTVQRRQNPRALNKFLAVNDSQYPFCSVLHQAASCGNFLLIKLLICDLKIDIDFNADSLPVGFHQWPKHLPTELPDRGMSHGRVDGHLKHRESSLKFSIELFSVSKYARHRGFNNLNDHNDLLLTRQHHHPFFEQSSLECVQIISEAMLKYQARRVANYRKRRMSSIYKGTTHKDREKYFREDLDELFEGNQENHHQSTSTSLWKNEKWKWIQSGMKKKKNEKNKTNLFDEPDAIWEVSRSANHKNVCINQKQYPTSGVRPFLTAALLSRPRELDACNSAGANKSRLGGGHPKDVHQTKLIEFMVKHLKCQVVPENAPDERIVVEKSYNPVLLRFYLEELLRREQEKHINDNDSSRIIFWKPLLYPQVYQRGQWLNLLRCCFYSTFLIAEICATSRVNIHLNNEIEDLGDSSPQNGYKIEEKMKKDCVAFIEEFFDFAQKHYGNHDDGCYIHDLLLFDYFFMPAKAEDSERRSNAVLVDWKTTFVDPCGEVYKNSDKTLLQQGDPVMEEILSVEKNHKKHVREFSLLRLLTLISSNNEHLVEYVLMKILCSKNLLLVRTMETLLRNHAFDLVERCFELRMPGILSLLEDKIFTTNPSMSNLPQTLLVSPTSTANCMGLFGVAVSTAFDFPTAFHFDRNQRKNVRRTSTMIAAALSTRGQQFVNEDQRRVQVEVIELLKFLMMGLRLKIEDFVSEETKENVLMLLARVPWQREITAGIFEFLFALRRIDLDQQNCWGRDLKQIVAAMGKPWILKIGNL